MENSKLWKSHSSKYLGQWPCFLSYGSSNFNTHTGELRLSNQHLDTDLAKKNNSRGEVFGALKCTFVCHLSRRSVARKMSQELKQTASGGTCEVSGAEIYCASRIPPSSTAEFIGNCTLSAQTLRHFPGADALCCGQPWVHYWHESIFTVFLKCDAQGLNSNIAALCIMIPLMSETIAV